MCNRPANGYGDEDVRFLAFFAVFVLSLIAGLALIGTLGWLAWRWLGPVVMGWWMG